MYDDSTTYPYETNNLNVQGYAYYHQPGLVPGDIPLTKNSYIQSVSGIYYMTEHGIKYETESDVYGSNFMGHSGRGRNTYQIRLQSERKGAKSVRITVDYYSGYAEQSEIHGSHFRT